MSNKSTDRLIEIIETRQYFHPEVVKAARIELRNRINTPNTIDI